MNMFQLHNNDRAQYNLTGQIIMSLSMAGIMGTLSHTKPAFTKKSESMSTLQFSSTYFKAMPLSACH